MIEIELKYALKDDYKVNLKNDKQIDIGYVELYLKKHNLKAYNLGIYKD